MSLQGSKEEDIDRLCFLRVQKLFKWITCHGTGRLIRKLPRIDRGAAEPPGLSLQGLAGPMLIAGDPLLRGARSRVTLPGPRATLALLFRGPGAAGHDRWSGLAFSPG